MGTSGNFFLYMMLKGMAAEGTVVGHEMASFSREIGRSGVGHAMAALDNGNSAEEEEKGHYNESCGLSDWTLFFTWVYHKATLRCTKPCGEACMGSRGFLAAGSVDSFVREGPLRDANTMRRIYLREGP